MNRRHLAAPFGFKISQTLFTSDFSIRSADIAAFKLDSEFKFDELKEINLTFEFKNMASTKVAMKTLVF